MVQREIADRLRAEPGTSVYGSPSVVAQLACEVELIRAVNRAVFRPRPRVDSALVRLRRVGPAPAAGVARLVREAFAHRRKPLASSLELAGGPSRQEVRAALGRLGLEAGRARRAAGAGAVRRARRRAGGGLTLRAPAKLNLCLYLWPAPGRRVARVALAVLPC